MVVCLMIFCVTLLLSYDWFKSDLIEPVIADRECHADTMICEFNTAGTVAIANWSTLVSINGSLLQRCLDNKDVTENDCPRDSESRLSFDFDSTLFTDFVSYLESGRT